jgi:microcompartment protein CcmK/EutM
MILAQVLGTVVSTRKDTGLLSLKLLLVREVDTQFKPAGNLVVAADAVGAGTGELVIVAQGSSARLTEVSRDKPVDAVVCGIVDAVEIDGRDAWLKHATVKAESGSRGRGAFPGDDDRRPPHRVHRERGALAPRGRSPCAGRRFRGAARHSSRSRHRGEGGA